MENAREAGVADKYEAYSAGTIGYHVGEPPDPRMVRVAAGHGKTYTHQAYQFIIPDLDRFDLIIVMDRENRGDVISLTRTPEQRAKVHLLREFDPKGGKDVPDPYYDGLDSFEEVYSMIDRSTKGLLNALENGKVR